MNKMLTFTTISVLAVMVGCKAVAITDADTIVVGETGVVSWTAPATGGPVVSYTVGLGADCATVTNSYDAGAALSFTLPLEELGVGDWCSYVVANNVDARGNNQIGPPSNQITFSIVEEVAAPGAPSNYTLEVSN